MVCFLAFLLEVVLKKGLKECGCEETYGNVMIDLKRLKAIELKINEKRYVVRTDMDEDVVVRGERVSLTY